MSEAGLALIDEARQLCEAMHADTFVLEARVRRLECLVALDRVDEAIEEGEAIRRSIGDGHDNPLLRVGLDRAVGRAYLRAGRAEEARLRLEAALALAEQSNAPFETAATLLAIDAPDGLSRAVAILADLGVVVPPR